MFKKILKYSLFIGFLILFVFFAPNTSYKPVIEIDTNKYTDEIFANNSSIPESHKKFILNLIPLIQFSNREVLQEREQLLLIISKANREKKIKLKEKQWLKKLEIKYSGESDGALFKNEKVEVLDYLNELLSRVDIVPIRLSLAQAAIESGWGNSRFCLEGNAFFGIHCYTSECGIKARDDQDGGFEVKSYLSAQESVDDYLLFLNSKRGTQRFRNERINYLYNDSIPDLGKLAGSMKGYSAIGLSYQQMIKSILKKYIPEELTDIY